MAMSSEEKSPVSTPELTSRQKALWLGKVGLSCFGIGAMTSALITLSPKMSFSRGSATPSTAVLAMGSIARQVSTQGLGAFPGEVSASFLCHPAIASLSTITTPTSTPAVPTTLVAGIVAPALSHLQKGVDPTLIQPFNAAPWPDINEAARAARVPVFMYHDILPEKQVFFDVTVEEFEDHLKQMKEAGVTPISFEQLVHHLRTGASLPSKPILLTFDDGYEGHYTHVYPLLKKYGYPATFSIFTGKLDSDIAGRSTVTWEQVQEMAADPLITIASHSVLHPKDLRELDDETLRKEVVESKARLEAELGIPIRYFTYPEGNYDERVAQAVADAGYDAALTMSNYSEWFANESDDLLAIGRFGQSSLARVLPEASAGVGAIAATVPPPNLESMATVPSDTFDFSSQITVAEDIETEAGYISLITGGRPGTVHADSRYQLVEILARTNAQAAVDGAFFSLKYLDSNVMIGPVLSQATQTFIPGNASENPLLNGRPLALISTDKVKFVPFDAAKHNTLHGIQAEMADVTDAFVGAAWLVRDGQPQPAEAFGNLFDFEVPRHRAFWGINRAGQPVIGVTKDRIDSVTLGSILHQVGFRDAMMVDSGASTSLAYNGESLVDYEPRPVPHVVALLAPENAQGTCPLTFEALPEEDEEIAEALY
jgi:peptidoglycan/xylan/chitin deacetylase (PgdA/CDA1 family)